MALTKNSVPNKKEICNALTELAAQDKDIVVLCSDSRGSASFDGFIQKYPERVVEVGIAEQNLVGVSAGLASCGKKPVAVSPACFLTSRSIEQVKVDVAYSNTNVKLLGISGGVSYGALGMSHHSAQDIAYTTSIPNMRTYLPSDRFQSAWLIKKLMQDSKPAYIRVGRNAVDDIYDESTEFELDRAKVLCEGTKIGIIVCGETVAQALRAAERLEQQGISCYVVDMYCLKPLDTERIVDVAEKTDVILTVEEHVPQGGLASLVSEVVCAEHPTRVVSLSLPDAPTVAGTPAQVFGYYGIDADGIERKALEVLGMGK